MAYPEGHDRGIDVTQLPVSIVDDSTFFLRRGEPLLSQNAQIFRTSFGISRDLMRCAKSKTELEVACQLEALTLHLAVINQHAMHSVKANTYGPRGLFRSMSGLVELVDKGVDLSKGVKLMALRGRCFKLIKHDPGPHWDPPVEGFKYHEFELLSEVSIGVCDDQRKTLPWNALAFCAETLKAGRKVG